MTPLDPSLFEDPSRLEREQARVVTVLRLAPAALLALYGVVCVLRQEAFAFEYLPVSHLVSPDVAGLEAGLAGLRYVLFALAAAAWLWDRPLSQAMEVVRTFAVIHGLLGGFVLFVLAAVLC